ncbi:hypothetical protein cce_5121 [Crocosphaera subtropica ATCC 51142]|uniref:Uncharacterized protein n=1 Tax=Crocosphaera subtropica (strain ATCC 51142 / BH68) TaxID=43989 RepID=B1X2V6_CROS5|nr:hypothetical protein [Crocosphaera subtropica]ACB54467.1 hypothetical protein cce_5121 [Crocosphaera subtropica ATCC 51142]
MNNYETIDALDIIDPGIEFDWTNWEDVGLLILVILFTFGVIVYVVHELKHSKDKPTHYYNRETGKVEELDE